MAMKRILITGGTGTIASAFIERYGADYKIGVFARSENRHGALHEKFPSTRHFYGSVENIVDVYRAIDAFQPNIIIHAAAMKHVEQCEADPLSAARVNVMGSINVIDAARRFGVELTIGVSTDKVHDNNVYGTTKRMMEQLFVSADTPANRFCCVRLGNVAGSEGSVIAKWKAQAAAGQALTITNAHMRRFWMTGTQKQSKSSTLQLTSTS
jgi:UDP-N-acetylglucosamine 4,6-dehydratase